MPHQRQRHLRDLLLRTLRFSPITGILGHRQVGKTTLASELSTAYTTMDTASDLSQALVEPAAFLALHQSKLLAIDECQHAAPLFPALKEWVRVNKRPGQFLLTGSVRFTSRKAIRESLTGRIVSWELLPMDWSEQHELPLPNSLNRLLESKSLGIDLKNSPRFTLKAYLNALDVGGLPGVFAVRDPAIRAQRFETQINTILERDLKLLIQTTLEFRTLRKLMVSLAKRAGTPLSVAEVARETRISLPTLRKLLSAFESLFLIRFIAPEGDFAKPTLFFEDQGECNHLRGSLEADSTQLLMFLYQNLRVQALYRPEQKIEMFTYREKNGHTVPLCFRKGKSVLGLIPFEPTQQQSELSSVLQTSKHFLKRYSGAKVLIVSVQDHDQMIAPGIRWMGAGRLI